MRHRVTPTRPPRARPPPAVCDRGHAVSGGGASERKRSSVPPSSTAARLWRAGGLLPAERCPHFLVIAPIPDLWQRFPPSARSGWPDGLSLLAPVGETHPEAQTRRDRGISTALRFRGAWFSPVTPEVGVAAAPPLALPLRASATARDAPQSDGRKRPPSHDVSRPSRRCPPRQRHADCGYPAEDASLGRPIQNLKSEIRNLKFLEHRASSIEIMGGNAQTFNVQRYNAWQSQPLVDRLERLQCAQGQAHLAIRRLGLAGVDPHQRGVE